MSAEELRARFVAALLVWHDVTPGELGELLGCTRDTVYKKLDGRRAFTAKDLTAIAERFDIDAGLLLRPQAAERVLGSVRQRVPDLLTWPKYQFRLVGRSSPFRWAERGHLEGELPLSRSSIAA